VPLAEEVIKQPADLKGKRVGVQLGTTGELMAQKIDGARVFSYDNIGAAFIDMQNGNLDAILNDYPTTEAYIRAHHTAKMVGDILSREHYGMAVRKGDMALREALNKGLAEIRRNGTYLSLHRKWFDTDPPASF